MSSWKKSYGIDDEGRRTIMITENAPEPSFTDKLFSMTEHVFGMIFAIGIVAFVIVTIAEVVFGSIGAFLSAHPWIIGIVIVIGILYFLGLVSHRMNDNSTRQSR